MRKILVALTLAFGFVLAPAAAASANTEPVDVILDEIGFFTPEEELRLTQSFEEVAEIYGILPVVEVVQNLGGDSPERYAIRRANELGIGDSEADNGLFILISVDERGLRVEPGLGLARVVTEQEIQRVIDNTMLPNFKNGDFVTGIDAGVWEIGEYSLVSDSVPAPAPVLPSAPIDLTPLWITLGSIAGAGALATGVTLGVKARAKAKRKAESERKSKVASEVDAAVKRFASNTVAQQAFAEAPNQSARFDRIEEQLNSAPFLDNDERVENLKRIEAAVALPLVNYSRIDSSFYKSRLDPKESVTNFAERVLEELPKAQAALAAAIEAERLRKEEERKRALRREEAQNNWKRLDRGRQEEFALAERSERKALATRLFSDYNEADKSSFYNSFADSLESDLKAEAKRAFDRLSRTERERIARASSYQRDDYLRQYMPGYNPALAAIYIASATSFMSTIRAEEAQAAAAASSSSSSSFGSYDSGSSFSGGGFDGGGGGGSW